MQRIVDEAEYVLTALCRMRDKVSADPKLFDSDAPERIGEAIARMQTVLVSARSESMVLSVEKEVKAA